MRGPPYSIEVRLTCRRALLALNALMFLVATVRVTLGLHALSNALSSGMGIAVYLGDLGHKAVLVRFALTCFDVSGTSFALSELTAF